MSMDRLNQDLRILYILISKLPPSQRWTADERRRWLHAFEMSLDLVIKTEDAAEAALIAGSV